MRSCTARVRVMRRAFPQVDVPDPMHPSSQSPIELAGLHASRQGALLTQNPSRESRSSTSPHPYGIWGCGYGGTRNRITSLRLQT
jgi:hypothetical protein